MKCRGSTIEDGRGAAPWSSGSRASRRALSESKSLKLYLNSLNFKRFASTEDALATTRTGRGVRRGLPRSELTALMIEDQPKMSGWTCVDDACGEEEVPESMLRKPDASLLKTTSDVVTERLCGHNLRTLCPVTGQPDWGTLLIEYEGPRVDHASLFLYIISLRTETGFHENAVERVALDVERRCRPAKLRVTGRFQGGRGGVDINPLRSPSARRGDGPGRAFAPGRARSRHARTGLELNVRRRSAAG